MTLETAKVLDFANSLMLGCSEEWGASWAQVEIDGFFFNQFLNPGLQSAIRLARLNVVCSESYSVSGLDVGRESEQVATEPIYSDSSPDQIDENPLASINSELAHSLATASAKDIDKNFLYAGIMSNAPLSTTGRWHSKECSFILGTKRLHRSAY